MKKILLFLFAMCFLLTGCNKQSQDSSSSSSSSSSSTPFYTNEEIRQKLKSSSFEYQSRIKEKTQFTLSGEFNAPDLEFEGMHVYKNLNVVVDSNVLDPFLKVKADVFLKENNVVSDIPTKRIEIIKQNQKAINPNFPNIGGLPAIGLPHNEYVLEKYVDNNKKYYSQTVDESGSLTFTGLINIITNFLKNFEIDDIPQTIEYSYNRENASYGMKIKFKDLDGTPLSEYLNIFLSFVPELNELLLKFKDEIIINFSNIKLDTPVSTFDIDILYPAMQGMFEFEVIHGSFNLSFKQIMRDDVTKFNIIDKYKKAKLHENNLNGYLQPIDNNGTTQYKAGIVLDSISVIDLSGIDINNLEKIDILPFIQNKKLKVKSSSALSIKYYDRYSHEELIFKDDIVDLGLMDSILIEATYANNIAKSISIEKVVEEPAPEEGTENL